ELEVSLAEREREVAELTADLQERRAALEREKQARRTLEARVEELTAELEAFRAQLAAKSDASGAAELRRIRGIGPKFAEALSAHGVTHVEQIAGWSDSDVEHHAALLKIHASRIRKGRWVEQAAEL